jgi:NAD(P)-dependent dehydrogenase (short-subunit alcohol dehydrogenase family)
MNAGHYLLELIKALPFPEHIVITGAGRGIGAAIARDLAAQKCNVLCISKTDSAAKIRDDISHAGGTATALQLDLADYLNVQAQVKDWLTKEKAERIGVVAAAAMLGPRGPLAQSELSEWDETFRVNVLGNLAAIKAALPVMEKAGFGRIVSLAGGGSAYAYPIFPSYACSKTAMVREIENLAEDLLGKGDIVATCVAPGAVETDMLTTVRAAGGDVRTVTDISEIVNFVRSFMKQTPALLSGRFVHVRDPWTAYAAGGGAEIKPDHWKLRRVE